MLEHLSNPEYVHTLLNPLPVYGLVTGVLALIIALVTQARAARVTALAIVFLAAASAWPAFEYGEKGYDRVLSMSDSDGAAWLKEHAHRADKLIYLFYALAALSAAGLVVEWKGSAKAATAVALVTVLLAGATLGSGVYIAYAGGRIRHREFRYEPPPSPPPEGEH